MNLTKYLSFLSAVIMLQTGAAQSSDGVGIGTTDVASSALLELKSSNRGLLVPRVSTLPTVTDTTNNGLLIYNTSNDSFYRWDSGTWERLIHEGSAANVSSVTATGNITTSTGTISGSTVTGTNISATGNISASGNVTAAEDITATGTVTAADFVGNGTVPVGGIIMWSGTTVPAGWALCDGTNSTPNLTERFIMAASSAGAGTGRVEINQSITTDYSSSGTGCSTYQYMYSGTVYYGESESETFEDVAASSCQDAAPDVDGPVHYVNCTETKDNPDYYMTKASCRVAAQFYKLAFIMRKD